MILILAATLASPSPAPAPSPSPAPDPCGIRHTNMLAALNRPSIGYSPCSVKPHETVLETGYQNASSASGSTPMYPQGFLRFGTAPNFELDLIDGGSFDSGLGAKYEIWHDGSRALGADFLYTAPTGAARYTAGGSTQTVNLDYAMPLSSKFGLASTLGMQRGYGTARDGIAGRFFTLLPSLLFSDQWSPRAQAYIEFFGQTRLRPDGGAMFGTDVALQYMLAPPLEIDAEIGQTATDVSRSHYVGFGFGVRF